MPEQIQIDSAFSKKKRLGGPLGQLQAQVPNIGLNLSQNQSGVGFAGQVPGQPAGQNQVMPLVAPNGAFQSPSGMPVGWMPPGMLKAKLGQVMPGNSTQLMAQKAAQAAAGQVPQPWTATPVTPYPAMSPGGVFSAYEQDAINAATPKPQKSKVFQQPKPKTPYQKRAFMAGGKWY